MRYTAIIHTRYFLIALIALSMLIPCLAFSDDSGDESKKENSLQPGSWSIQFQLEEELSLEPFDGLIIAMKRHFSKHTALRIGFDLDLEFADDEDQEKIFSGDSLIGTRNSAFDRNMQRLDVDFLYLKYPNPEATINFFWGIGPLIMFSRNKSERVSINAVIEDESTTESWTRIWAAGGRGLIGVEWFVAEGISFHGEYRASFSYWHTKNENTSINQHGDYPVRRETRESTDKKWNFDGAHVVAGVSLYF